MLSEVPAGADPWSYSLVGAPSTREPDTATV